jgi:hypothetical protein
MQHNLWATQYMQMKTAVAKEAGIGQGMLNMVGRANRATAGFVRSNMPEKYYNAHVMAQEGRMGLRKANQEVQQGFPILRRQAGQAIDDRAIAAHPNQNPAAVQRETAHLKNMADSGFSALSSAVQVKGPMQKAYQTLRVNAGKALKPWMAEPTMIPNPKAPEHQAPAVNFQVPAVGRSVPGVAH